MDKPIAVGDLVAIILPGCKEDNVGCIFRVKDVSAQPRRCDGCQLIHGHGNWAQRPVDDRWIAFSRLKRIPPLDDLNGSSEDARNGQNDKVRA